MKVSSIGSDFSIRSTGIGPVKQTISPDVVEQINRTVHSDIVERSKQFQKNKDKRKRYARLTDHNDFFLPLFCDNNVEDSYGGEQEVLEDLKKLIFSTQMGHNLKREFEYLEKNERIKIPLAKRDAYGTCETNLKNVADTRIFLHANRPLNFMAATLIHELRHFKDSVDTATDIRRFSYTVFDTEINAFLKSQHCSVKKASLISPK